MPDVPDVGGSGDKGTGSSGSSSGGGGVAKVLPKMGGVTLPIVGVAGALLVGAGLLVRRMR